MKSKKSVLISGYYGFDNSGDDAILKAIVKDIRSYDDNININVLSKNPFKTEKMYNVRAIDRFKIKEVFKSIKETSLFISGGGSLLQDMTSTRSLLYYLFLMNLAKILKKPVAVYANGIGPINRKINRMLTKFVLNKVDLITLRDNDSKIFLDNLGVRNNNIYVTADPVFTLDAAKADRVKAIFSIEAIDTSKKLVGIAIREWKLSNNMVSTMAEAINYMIKKYDVNIVMIPMHYPEDLDISNKIKDLVGARCFVLKENYNVEEIIGVISFTEMVIAMRLHSLIYSATVNIPMIGISYDPKINGVLNSLEINNICSVDNLKYEELVKHIDFVFENREILALKLQEKNKVLKEKALLNTNKALDLLNKKSS